MPFLILFAVLIVGYLFGSIPCGVIVSKIFFHYDIRDFGSHNSGGTNAGRVMGKKFGLLVIFLDMLKLFIPYFTVWLLFTKTNLINYSINEMPEIFYYGCALTTLIGHCWPVFANFKGGKAVSCTAATIISTSWISLIGAGLSFFVTLKCSKFVSLSSIIGSLVATLLSFLVFVPGINEFITYPGMANNFTYPILMTFETIILIIRHSQNIKRIVKHEESKISWLK